MSSIHRLAARAPSRRQFRSSASVIVLTLSCSCILAAVPATAEPAATELPAISVTASRLDPSTDNIVGVSRAVITAEQIARAPELSLQGIIAQTPGVQLQSLYGGPNGAGTSVDLRGFGAFATANTLVLINGRRLNDLDLDGVDFTQIPRDSIERIEITRGNSGAVLYGDNAVGGVINIVTKNGAGAGPAVSGRIEGGFGSFNSVQGAASLTLRQGPWSAAVFGNVFNTDGWRTNNYSNQLNGNGDIRYNTPDFSAYLSMSGYNGELGLPGARRVDPTTGTNQLVNDPRGATTPFDYGNRQGASLTTGFTKTFVNGLDLIVDGGVRTKNQQGGYFGPVPLQDFNASYVPSQLTTWSLTPRLAISSPIFGLPSSVLTGIDFYDAIYNSPRSQYAWTAPVHTYDLSQPSLAAYWQQRVSVAPTTEVSFGGRVQRTWINARDRLDMDAPGWFGDLQTAPLNDAQTNTAYHLGLEHRFNDMFTVFARTASAFRTPNVDERVASGPKFDGITFMPLPVAFNLKTQTSQDAEAGLRFAYGAFNLQTSLYGMNLENEIHFNPVQFYNYNLDPTRRYGSETSATWRISDTVVLRGGFAYTRAVFREGQYTGNDVPLVSPYSGSAGVTWNIIGNYLVLDASLRAWSSRYMDNDQQNQQQKIPGNATVDLKLSGAWKQAFWQLYVTNLLNAAYYDYAVASAYTPGVYNAYPLAGRAYMLKAGATF